jgi:hypothetical protein
VSGLCVDECGERSFFDECEDDLVHLTGWLASSAAAYASSTALKRQKYVFISPSRTQRLTASSILLHRGLFPNDSFAGDSLAVKSTIDGLRNASVSCAIGAESGWASNGRASGLRKRLTGSWTHIAASAQYWRQCRRLSLPASLKRANASQKRVREPALVQQPQRLQARERALLARLQRDRREPFSPIVAVKHLRLAPRVLRDLNPQGQNPRCAPAQERVRAVGRHRAELRRLVGERPDHIVVREPQVQLRLTQLQV